MSNIFALVGELKELIPGRIKEIRENADMTQDDLAKKMNVKRQVIQRWETSPQNIGVGKLEQIAEACGVSVFDLVKPKSNTNS